MNIRDFHLGPLETNGFLLYRKGRGVFIDPGGDPAPVLDFLKKEEIALEAVINTHLHFDHTFGNKALSEATGASILANPEDAFLLDTEVGRGGAFGLPLVPPYEYEPLGPGEQEFAGSACRILATPGHTPGSLSLYFPESQALFSGDLIFYRSIGRTDFPGGDLSQLTESVKEKVFTLSDETVIYSGHGPVTTVGEERNHNPFFQGY